MIVVNTHEAKTHLSRLLRLVAEEHETVRICRGGKVMAELVAPRSRQVSTPKPLVQHPQLAGVVFHEDPAAPLPDEFGPDYGNGEEKVVDASS